jgi:hypothetical protein
MISSVMKDRLSDRAAIARIIREEQAIPWYADDPPHEFRGVSPEDTSFEMARNCDLYLLIIFPQYGTQVSADDSRSVTHQEFAAARAENPQKVEVFIAVFQAEAAQRSDAPPPDQFGSRADALLQALQLRRSDLAP